MKKGYGNVQTCESANKSQFTEITTNRRHVDTLFHLSNLSFNSQSKLLARFTLITQITLHAVGNRLVLCHVLFGLRQLSLQI